jgi:hypothetical protein
MISNERPSPYGQRPNEQPKPHVPEDTLKHGQVMIERKTFVLTLRQNARGRFLRIIEGGGGRHETIIVPDSGLVEFQRVLGEMVKASNEMPSAVGSPEDPLQAM